MLGAIIGDIVGSRFEFNNTDKTDFELFTPECSYTDDTICTVAIADAILNGKSYKESLLEWCRKYPNPKGAYGASFARWIQSEDPQPYNSYGNGSAMRVSPVAYAFSRDRMLTEAAKSAAVTHNHPEGIKGAQAVCFAISMALEKWSKHEIQLNIEHRYDYDLHRSVKHIRQDYQFNETCPGSVPEAIICFLEANSFEETIRLAVSIGGDSDTIAAIAGSIAESYYLIPENIKSQALAFIPGDMRTIVEQFYNTIQNG